MLELAVHPLAPVTVTVYVPAVVNPLAAVPGVFPPLQAYVVPPVAVTLIGVVEQVKMVEPVLFVIAAEEEEVTTAVVWAVPVQPPTRVTVTV